MLASRRVPVLLRKSLRMAGAAGYADVLLDLLFRWQGLAAASVAAA
jgi:hypothetical protein